MHKDTVRMRDYNAFHGVPEFVLLFPEPDDPRSVVWHHYDASSGAYQVVVLPADRRYRSRAIPGLELEVLEPSAWTEGRKVRVHYQGREFRDAQVEEQAREAAERQAQQERQVREAAERTAQQERQVREGAERRAQQERQVREAAERRAQQERQVREAAEQQVEQLLARLKQAGLEP
jgi:flagellar biosynthesis GTPase FlhF